MTVTEKVSYLKGLMEGLDYDTDTKEGRIIRMMADILDDLAQEVQRQEDEIADMGEYMEAMDEDLTNVEDELFGEEEDDCCCDDCEDGDCCCDDEAAYEIVCPHCGKTICFEEQPEGETFVCPACSKEIPLELE